MPKPIVPDKIKVLRGTNQKCRMNPEQPEFTQVDLIPPAPDYLTGEALKIYEEVGMQLMANRLLDVANLHILIAYSNEMGKYVEYEKELKKDNSRILINQQKNVTRNPLDRMATESLLTALRLANELGITPASKQKIKAPKKESSTDRLIG